MSYECWNLIINGLVAVGTGQGGQGDGGIDHFYR